MGAQVAPAAEAEFHYKVAIAALKDNNLEVALNELEQAAALAPQNALVRYNLAVVKHKKGDPFAAMGDLNLAVSLELPASQKTAVDELRVDVTYAIQRLRTGVVGRWETRFRSDTEGVPAEKSVVVAVFDVTAAERYAAGWRSKRQLTLE